jgi:signal peptidase II
VIVVVGLALMGGVAVLAWRADNRRRALGLGIILGGALGNMVDRAFRAGDGFLSGQVVDFVDLGWWPVFNLADAALWIGIGLLVLSAGGVVERA